MLSKGGSEAVVSMSHCSDPQPQPAIRILAPLSHTYQGVDRTRPLGAQQFDGLEHVHQLVQLHSLDGRVDGAERPAAAHAVAGEMRNTRRVRRWTLQPTYDTTGKEGEVGRRGKEGDALSNAPAVNNDCLVARALLWLLDSGHQVLDSCVRGGHAAVRPARVLMMVHGQALARVLKWKKTDVSLDSGEKIASLSWVYCASSQLLC